MDKLSKSLENYLFEIYKLSNSTGQTTPRELSFAVGFNKASTREAIKVLSKKGLVEYSPYKPIKLTEMGAESAKEIEKRRNITSEFLKKFLFLKGEDNLRETKTLEPELSDFLLKRISMLVDFLVFCPNEEQNKKEIYESYIKDGEISDKCATCIERAAEGKKVLCKH